MDAVAADEDEEEDEEEDKDKEEGQRKGAERNEEGGSKKWGGREEEEEGQYLVCWRPGAKSQSAMESPRGQFVDSTEKPTTYQSHPPVV